MKLYLSNHLSTIEKHKCLIASFYLLRGMSGSIVVTTIIQVNETHYVT